MTFVISFFQVHSLMIAATHYLKIFNPIVTSIPVFMMHNFVVSELATKMQFHQMPMNFAALSVNRYSQVWDTPFPVWVCFFAVLIVAFTRAINFIFKLTFFDHKRGLTIKAGLLNPFFGFFLAAQRRMIAFIRAIQCFFSSIVVDQKFSSANRAVFVFHGSLLQLDVNASQADIEQDGEYWPTPRGR